MTDMNETLLYLETRATELKNYSEKLRDNFMRLIGVFDDDTDICRICWGYSAKEHSSEFPTPNENYDHVFKPCIKLGLNENISVEISRKNDGMGDFWDVTELTLRAKNDQIYLRTRTVYEHPDYDDRISYSTWDNVSSDMIKKIVKENKLIELFEKIRARMDEKTEDYKAVAEMSDNMMRAVGLKIIG